MVGDPTNLTDGTATPVPDPPGPAAAKATADSKRKRRLLILIAGFIGSLVLAGALLVLMKKPSTRENQAGSAPSAGSVTADTALLAKTDSPTRSAAGESVTAIAPLPAAETAARKPAEPEKAPAPSLVETKPSAPATEPPVLTTEQVLAMKESERPGAARPREPKFVRRQRNGDVVHDFVNFAPTP